MRLVDNNDDLALHIIFGIVISVLYDLVVDVFEYQKHLGIRDHGVAVCEQALEVKYGKVLVRGESGNTVPDVRVSSACGKFADIIHECTEEVS